MIRNKDDFKQEYKRIANKMFRRDPEHLNDKDKFAVLAKLVEREAAEKTSAVEILSGQKKNEDKRIHPSRIQRLKVLRKWAHTLKHCSR